MRVLIVEDDLANLKMLEYTFTTNKFDVVLADNGETGLELATKEPFDCVVLDIGLPKIDGLTILKELRQSKNYIPVVMLTAEADLETKVSGLSFGADDYVTKPFEPLELIARVNSQIRRNTAYTKTEEAELQCGELHLDLINRVFKVNGVSVILTNNEFKLMSYFMNNPNSVLSKQDISKEVWGLDFDTRTNFVNVYVSYLRQKIADNSKRDYIETVRGQGFSFICE